MRTTRSATLALALMLVPLAIVTAAPASAARSCHGQKATIVGTRGDDDLQGTTRDDVIVGLGGDDVVRGLGGNDVLCGSAGEDRLLGAGGDDDLDGGGDNDELLGAGGDDQQTGGDGRDEIDGGPGTDVTSYADSPNAVRVDLFAGTGRGWGTDTLAALEGLIGSDHDDTLVGGRSGDTISGGAGNDAINGGQGDDLLDGGDGDDKIEGSAGFRNVVTFAGSPAGVTVDLDAGTVTGWGSDTLASVQIIVGSPFDDTFTGDRRNNVFAPGEGDDVVTGGGGRDQLDLSGATSSVIVDLTAGTATGQGTDTLQEIGSVLGSPAADTITGDQRHNTLSGGAGDDVIVGNEGDDTLDGGEGTDSLTGGTGSDTCVNGEIVAECEA